MKNKKIYAAIIVVALMLSILPFSAMAATNYDLYVGGARFTSSNLTIDKNDRNSGVTAGRADYDPSTNTLTLDNITVKNAVSKFTLEMEGMELGSVSVVTYTGDAPLTIKLKGTNTVRAAATSTMEFLVIFNSAVRSEKAPVTITSDDGKGVLFADGSSALTTTGLGYGLYVYSKLTIDNCTVEATGPLSESGLSKPLASYGISAGYGITITNSKVTATGGLTTNGENNMSFGMYSEEKGIDITNSTVTAKSGVGRIGAAIVSEGAVNIKNSTLKTTGTNGATMAFGIMADSGVSIDKSTVETISANTVAGEDAISCGIVAIGELGIKNGSKVKASGGNATASIGLCAGDDELGIAKGVIKISDSEVTATGETVGVNLKPDTKSYTADHTVSVSTKTDGSDAIKWKAEFDSVQDKILEYKYYKIEPGIIDINCPSAKFKDVPKNIWYHEYVDYAIERGFMNGTGADTFEPTANITRAMFTQLLSNIEGKPQPEKLDTFTDVKPKDWFAASVNWAAEQGLVNGVGDGKFDPNKNITRQEMAVLLYRYAAWKKLDTTASKDISGFVDADLVSSWAVEGLQWAHAAGLVNGNDDGTLNPLGSATRAEIATIITRFVKYFNM